MRYSFLGALVLAFVFGTTASIWAKNSIEIAGERPRVTIGNCDFGQLIESLELRPATFKLFGGEKSVSTLASKVFGMGFEIQITGCPLEAVEKFQTHYDSVAYITGTATNLKGFDETYSEYKARFYSTFISIDGVGLRELRVILDLENVPAELAEKLFITLGPVTLIGWAEIVGVKTFNPSSSALWNIFFEMPEQPDGIVLALIRLSPRIINGYDIEEIREQTYSRLLREREKQCEQIYNDLYADLLPRSEFRCVFEDADF